MIQQTETAFVNETMQAPADSSANSGARRLYRHPTAGQLGGVCAGLADAFGWDPTAVRVLWVVATLMTSGAGLLVYLLLWALLPVGTQAGGRMRAGAFEAGGAGLPKAAVALLAVGGVWLLSNLGVLPEIGRLVGFFMRVLFWPALLMGLGYWLLRQGNVNAVHRAGTRLHGQAADQGQQRRHRAAAGTPEPAAVQTQYGNRRSAMSGRPLQRSRNGRIFLGVAAGMARWLNIDPVVARLLWVLLIVGTGGVGLILYLVGGVLIPLEPSGADPFLTLRPYSGPQTLPEEFQAVPIERAPAASDERVDLKAVSLEELDRAEQQNRLPGEVAYL